MKKVIIKGIQLTFPLCVRFIALSMSLSGQPLFFKVCFSLESGIPWASLDLIQLINCLSAIFNHQP